MSVKTPKFKRFARTSLVFGTTLLISSCSTQQITSIALSKDPKAALKALGQNKVDTYKRDPQALLADFERLKVELDRLFGNLKQESSKRWGSEEAQELPSAKRYVKYTEQYKNRVIVDYEKGWIRIEHIQDPQVSEKLQRAVAVALLTPDDPKSADVFSDAEVKLDGKPFLQDLVLDERRQPLSSSADVERFADYLVRNRLQKRVVRVGNSPLTIMYVQIDMISAETAPVIAQKPVVKKPPRPKAAVATTMDERPDLKAGNRSDPNRYAAADKLAPRYLPMVNKYAQATGVDPALIFGIIYQESRFNPFAVSQAEAYGMMQLVPKSGGIEAFRKAKGEAVQPTKEYLMDPENNIELGATYLGMLLYDFWTKAVQNRPAREYCAISGYNTGAGNVARALTGSTRQLSEAQNKANSMQPDELFEYLRANLPFAETRDYLLRVSAARRHYKEMFYPDS